MLEDSPGYQELIARGEAQGREIGKKIGREIGKKIGREIGKEIGKEIGEAIALRRAIIRLVRSRMDAEPAGLAEQLEALSARELDPLFDRVLGAQDAETVDAVLASLWR